ncbi:hypothetical protein P175DRAFT_039312 [Aspergillus ochraceoroseus IBT 24754]|uniref:Uncharacterized protein n=1 Tax=Aspergillus ochraceoroseus IBT 24754 TaxID=1392256 RepID=A0A2T5M7L1_9EURO|nr:uncharacterized protein P175DRAFT_039312 [Aspergillus ochraceoroseus IBT 24754]PTU24530.1 hypothetical protein P175DRAFT_039312 [Aspergillus ochraceoroseus IBT 24754]
MEDCCPGPLLLAYMAGLFLLWSDNRPLDDPQTASVSVVRAQDYGPCPWPFHVCYAGNPVQRGYSDPIKEAELELNCLCLCPGTETRVRLS